MLEPTLGIGALPRQTGVYVPRRLSRAGGPVKGAPGRGRDDPCHFHVAGELPPRPRASPRILC